MERTIQKKDFTFFYSITYSYRGFAPKIRSINFLNKLYLNIYKQIFEVFTKYNKISNKVLVEFSHDLASISKIGVQKLEQFWGDWKRDCNIQI